VSYVALVPIDHGGVRAYAPGDPVPAANVEANGYEVGAQVAEAGSDQAVEALRALGILPPEAEEPTLPDGADETGGPEADLARWTVDEVNAWLDDHPDQATTVLAAERDGKSRAGVLHGRHGAPPDVAEA
jgi:hypothetical protein